MKDFVGVAYVAVLIGVLAFSAFCIVYTLDALWGPGAVK